jgi:hypothetical protein
MSFLRGIQAILLIDSLKYFKFNNFIAGLKLGKQDYGILKLSPQR